MVIGRKNNQPQRKKGQPVIRLSQLAREREAEIVSKVKITRIKRRYIPLGFSNKLVITFRKFKTSKAKRSKKSKQFVLPLPFSSYKELVISQAHAPRRAKRGKNGRFVTSAPIILRRSAIITALLIIVGLSSSIYFGMELTKKPSALTPVATNAIPTPAPKPADPPAPKVLPESEPTGLKIERLGIQTSLISIGRNADSTMEVPKDPNVAGWYRFAPTPGELGPAVIVGHVDSVKGPAIFWRLREMVPGDIVEITRADGKVINFKVDAVKQFEQAAFPTQEVYGNIDHAGIRLITCGGVFNRDTRHYSHNTVVYGRLII